METVEIDVNSEAVENLREALKHIAVVGALVEIDEISDTDRYKINALSKVIMREITEISPDLWPSEPVTVESENHNPSMYGSNLGEQAPKNEELVSPKKLDRRIKDWFESRGEQATETRVDIVRAIITHFQDGEFYLSELYECLAMDAQGVVNPSLVDNYTQVFTRSKLRALGLIRHNGERTSKVMYSLNKELAKEHGLLVRTTKLTETEAAAVTHVGDESDTSIDRDGHGYNLPEHTEVVASDFPSLSEVEVQALGSIRTQIDNRQWFRRADVSFADAQHTSAFTRLMTKLEASGIVEHNGGHARGSKYRFIQDGESSKLQAEESDKNEIDIKVPLDGSELTTTGETVKKN